MKITKYNSQERGHTSIGWLESWHSFSFGSFYHPGLMGFGNLRVLNDDTVAPGMGFAKHPHDNMEIISIPLEGELQHNDSTGKSSIIRQGDVQIMSAGTGILHSEKNASSKNPVKFLQIWILPEKRGISPRYDQRSFPRENRMNFLKTVVDPHGKDGVQINQQAWLHLGSFDRKDKIEFSVKKKGNRLFLFVIEGQVTVNDEQATRRDALGITHFEKISADVYPGSELLFIEL